jgi:hypothetical protein
LAPVQYYCKLYAYSEVRIEACEHYVKQSYRNRCLIAGPQGPLALTVPVEKSDDLKCPTRDIRISGHGHWRHQHWNALVSAYGLSPFFEYYADDFRPFFEKPYAYLLDFNEALRELVCNLIGLQPVIERTGTYLAKPEDPDFREVIRPRHPLPDPAFQARPYYQVFAGRLGFIPNLSIVDLLFNMGPESLLVLRDSILPGK